MYEILIVGGGPAGLTAAIYAARAGKHVAVLERGSTGGQIISAPLVENYPGIPSVSGTELARQMTEQACTFGAEIVYTEAVGLEKTPAGFRVLCTDGAREAKTVILATGAAHRRLDLPWETTLTGCGVSYCNLVPGVFAKQNKNGIPVPGLLVCLLLWAAAIRRCKTRCFWQTPAAASRLSIGVTPSAQALIWLAVRSGRRISGSFGTIRYRSFFGLEMS